MQKQKEQKIRIFNLAHELNMESKALVELCKQNGIEVKNQLSTVGPEQRAAIEDLVKSGSSSSASKARPTSTATMKPTQKPMRNLDSKKGRAKSEQPVEQEQPTEDPEALKETKIDTPALAEEKAEAPETVAEETKPEKAEPAAEKPSKKAEPSEKEEPATAEEKASPKKPAAKKDEPEEKPKKAEPSPKTEAPSIAPRPYNPIIPGNQGSVRDLSSSRGGSSGPDSGSKSSTDKPAPTKAGGSSHTFAAPPKPNLTTAKKKKEKEPKKPTGVVKVGDVKGPMGAKDLKRMLRERQESGGNTPRSENVPVPPDDEGDRKGGGKGRGGASKGRGGAVVNRDERHRERQRRKAAMGGDNRGRGGLERDDEPRSFRGYRDRRRRRSAVPDTSKPRTGNVPIDLPITVRSLSEATGIRSNILLGKLMGQGLLITINSVIDPELAEMLALEDGIELDIKRQLDAEEKALQQIEEPDNPEDLEPRAPIVTVMGHVDHGKTSLLDQIRKSNVVDGEEGGITQVIRAWRVKHDGKPVTFIDTPGHEAFTKMRARGANITDVAVIVVAADDGIMPQTEEAINHAKAAGVSIVVAINKIDLPNANIPKAEQQLYGMELIPDNMGGDVPFVYTSAATGDGIDDLLENLSIVAELKELQANPKKTGRGVCLEAHLDEEEGVFATLLVQDGTLNKGDVIVCGAAYGRVRAMYSDLGRATEKAGPSVPVRITGLDQVPNADDSFMVVSDLATARQIAEKRKNIELESSQVSRKTFSWEDMEKGEIDELKIILKADARGSIEAIKAEFDKMQHDEVGVRVLHAAIGGISESDVTLALTSPEDTMILGFNVVADDRARSLAEERGIEMRTYGVIYQLTDDVRNALEGKLKPHEEVVQLGRAVVRNTFKISRVGTIAGCYVTQGTIERSARVRIIRNGVVVYPPNEKVVGLDSLKRFKDDVRDVREGLECGIKVTGYDDVKTDDVIEAYRIEQIQRKLE